MSKYLQKKQCFQHPNTLMLQVGKKLTFHLPAYLTIEVRNFKSLSLQQLTAEAYISMQLAINTTGLDDILITQLDKLTINLPLQGNIELGSKKNKTLDIESTLWESQDKTKKLKIFKLNKIFKMIVQPYTKLTPFQIIDLLLTVNIKTLKIQFSKKDIKQPNSKKIQNLSLQIKLNLMDDFQNPFETQQYQNDSENQKRSKKAKISFSSDGSFGNYDLAEAKLAVQYTMKSQQSTLVDLKKYYWNQQWWKTTESQQKAQKKKINRMKMDEKTKFMQYAHFHIPLYKFPFVPLFIVLVPLTLLGVINIAIFFQDQNLADRVGNISTLMIAFVGMIPVIREQIPPTPYITVIQIFVYLEIITAFLCLAHSWARSAGVEFSGYPIIFLILSILITSIVFFVPLIVLVLHLVWFENTYNKEGSYKKQKYEEDFCTKWNGNKESARYFEFQQKEGKILVWYLEEDQIKIKKELDQLKQLIKKDTN